MKQRLLIWLGLALSALMLYYSFRGVDVVALGRGIARIGWKRPLAAATIYLATFWVRGWRSGIIFREHHGVGFGMASVSVVISYACNNLFPLKGGEMVRALYLKHKAEIPKSISLGYICIERVFDAIVIIWILASCLMLAPASRAALELRQTLAVLWVAMLGSLAGLIALILWSQRLTCRITAMTKSSRLPGVRFAGEKLCNFLLPFQSIKNIWVFLEILAITVLIWTVEGLVFYIFLTPSAGAFSEAYIWMAVLSLSFLAPAAPGNIGLYQWVTLFVLELFEVDKTDALSLGIVAQASQFLPITTLGVLLGICDGGRQLLRTFVSTAMRDVPDDTN